MTNTPASVAVVQASLLETLRVYAGGPLHQGPLHIGVHDAQALLSALDRLAFQQPTEKANDALVLDTDCTSDRSDHRGVCEGQRNGLVAFQQPGWEVGDMVCAQIAMGHGLVDVGQIHWQGRTGVLFAPREQHVPVGEDGVVKGDYWPKPGDVVIWVDDPRGADVVIGEFAPLAKTAPDAALRLAHDYFAQVGVGDLPGNGSYAEKRDTALKHLGAIALAATPSQKQGEGL